MEINLRKVNRKNEKLPPIRITEEEKKVIAEEADKLGLTLTDFMRLCIEEYFKIKATSNNE